MIRADTVLAELRAISDTFIAGSGFVEFHEVRAALKRLDITKSKNQVRKLMAEYDDNGDGVLSLSDFSIMVRNEMSE